VAPLPGTLMLTLAMLPRGVLVGTMVTRALMTRAMLASALLAGAMVASTMLSDRVHADVHVPGVVGNLDVDELVDPVAFGHGFLR
jgi:hypothetical protein